ncbi:MAG: DUF1553 domain-containing protein [Planctomycetes bacterium]|nr:DUF1553 domain-containing protein [Planctomycetota bacterium]
MNTRPISDVARATACCTVALLALLFQVSRVSSATDDHIDYLTQIKPMLRERCFACHGALKQEGGLRLDTAALAIKGGDSGAAILPGDAAASVLLERVSSSDEGERMPPEGEPLKPDQIAALRGWIVQEAIAPEDEQAERDPREHWAFKPPVRPIVPQVDQPTPEQARWQRNPIDAFIASEHRKRGLAPQADADKRVWLRRVTLDLIGLPPTSEELDAFIADESSEAYDTIVTRLLKTPQYGQRWGRHWMDIWRYSDWWGLGAEVRNSQKHIWHWRDWIVGSLNEDKGYDQMLREMLAADELYPNDPDLLRATGFLVRQYFIFNRTTWLDNTIEHSAKAMLGLTFNCAKCHDHKYDPLTHVEYYRFRALFEPYQIRHDMVPGQTDFEKDGIPRAFDAHLDIPTYLHVRGDDRTPDKSRTLEPGVPAFLSLDALSFAIEPVSLPVEATYPGLRPIVLKTHREAAEQQIASARADVVVAAKKLAESQAATKNATNLPVDQATLAVAIAAQAVKTAEAQLVSIEARAAADRVRYTTPAADSDSATNTLFLAASKTERVLAASRAEEAVHRAELALLQSAADKKADAENKLAAAKTALETSLKTIDTPNENYTSLPGAKKTQEDYQNRNANAPYPPTSSGRRTALAKWLTDPRHPLPARVAINHIWSRHMGKPLVPTVFDFGRKGTPPTHPALLDWLAVELVEHNWSMKHIHRLIVTSLAYRLSSSNAGVLDTTLAADPDNHFYWRMNPVRMEAQIVRDSLLSLAGELDVSLGGPSIAVNDKAARRRSLYFVHSHNDQQKFLSMFDDANVLDCYRRAESIVPQQALALENSPLVTEMADKITQRINIASPDTSDSDFLRTAFITILSVEPTPDEQAALAELLQRTTELAIAKKRGDPATAARTSVVHTILNHNDFITVR